MNLLGFLSFQRSDYAKSGLKYSKLDYVGGKIAVWCSWMSYHLLKTKK